MWRNGGNAGSAAKENKIKCGTLGGDEGKASFAYDPVFSLLSEWREGKKVGARVE